MSNNKAAIEILLLKAEINFLKHKLEHRGAEIGILKHQLKFGEQAKRIVELENALAGLKELKLAANPFAKTCFTMSERDLSGYRLIIGFETLTDVKKARQYIVDLQHNTEVQL